MKVIYDKTKQRLPIKTWTDPSTIEPAALQQLINASNHPAARHWVAAMADTHCGYGVSIGSVWCLKNAVCISGVGVDIGCGMLAIPTGRTVAEVQPVLKDILKQIRRDVPVGRNHRKPATVPAWSKKDADDMVCEWYGDIAAAQYPAGLPTECEISSQIGTLGGNNHFIEIQKDASDQVWVMMHSGSRNLGKKTCDYYAKIATQLCDKYYSALPDKDLAFLPLDSNEGQAYFKAMNFLLGFALANRKCMLGFVHYAFERNGVPFTCGDDWQNALINIHHNFAAIENHCGENLVVHRKGATEVREGKIGIIPGSMGSPSYIVRGKGNPESFCSSSHGAGRTMSRNDAKKIITADDFKAAMTGIELGFDGERLDEAPQAYKDIHDVMRQQSDLVDIVTELHPIAVIKG